MNLESPVDTMLRIARTLIAPATTLILKHSQSLYRPVDRQPSWIELRDDLVWEITSDEGRAIQQGLRQQIELIRTSLNAIADEALWKQLWGELLTSDVLLSDGSRMFQGNADERLGKFTASIGAFIASLQNLVDDRAGECLVMPDTNAVLYNPDIESWTFSGIASFTLVLTPTLLRELDKAKMHRNQNVQANAEKVIRRLKEYRRRGHLHEGVTIVKGKIKLFAVPREPTFKKTPEWLDRSVEDDRLLASFLEICRDHPKCSTVLVTGDLNL